MRIDLLAETFQFGLGNIITDNGVTQPFLTLEITSLQGDTFRFFFPGETEINEEAMIEFNTRMGQLIGAISA